MTPKLALSEHPILFSTDMVRAILEGRKTQTRRVMMPQPKTELFERDKNLLDSTRTIYPRGQHLGKVGDRLWVRETWNQDTGLAGNKIHYRADGIERWAWCPSIFMPRWASRITLEVTEVRGERLQDITDKDARAEGFPLALSRPPMLWYRDLWNSINAKRVYGWDTNPWVWALSFKRVPQLPAPTGEKQEE